MCTFSREDPHAVDRDVTKGAWAFNLAGPWQRGGRRATAPRRHHAGMVARQRSGGACHRVTSWLRFRRALYAAFGRRRDALFDLVDALLTTAPAPSLVHLCLAPAHRRGWGSLYAALRRGQIDADAVRALLLAQPAVPGPPGVRRRRQRLAPPRRRDQPGAGLPLLLALPADRLRRRAGLGLPVGRAAQPGARQLDRARRRAARAAHRAGDPGRGRAGARHRRAPAAGAAGRGRRCSSSTPGTTPRTSPWPWPTPRPRCSIRLRSNRCFYADLEGQPGPNPPPAQVPAERRQVRLQRPRHVAGPGRASLRCEDALYGHVDARAWAGLHSNVRKPPPAGRYRPRLPRPRHHPPGAGLPAARAPADARDRCGCGTRARAARTSPPPPELERLWRAYCRRYDLEQTFRFLKQVLGWVTPRVRLPEQADRWTWLVAAAYTQLRLVRAAVADRRLPWERPLPPERLPPVGCSGAL